MDWYFLIKGNFNTTHMADKVKSYEAKCPYCSHLNKRETCINCKKKETLTLVKDDAGKFTGFTCSNGQAYSNMKCTNCQTVIHWQFFVIDGVPITPPKAKPSEGWFTVLIVVIGILVVLGKCA